MAVIEGNNPGRVWVDELINPSICLVITNGGCNADNIGSAQVSNKLGFKEEKRYWFLII